MPILDENELIHTQVTRPQVPILDDGQGNYNLSPIGFPIVNNSGDTNPTLFIPNFDVGRIKPEVINSNVALHGLQGFVPGHLVKLTAQTITADNGNYYVRIGTWDKIVPYKYDGTENDNKQGHYEVECIVISTNITLSGLHGYIDGDLVKLTAQTNPSENGKYYVRIGAWEAYTTVLNHYRNGYSQSEIADYLRDNLKPALNLAKFNGKRKVGNGPLYQWFTGGKPVNVGGGSVNKTVFIDPFNSGKFKIDGVKRTPGQLDVNDKAEVQNQRDLSHRERKMARWSLTNHHTEGTRGRNKSPFVRDYPFSYNRQYENKIFSGGNDANYVELDNWRINIDGATAINLRPFCDDSLYYQRENSYHNNITIDMTKDNMLGRQHVSILHHLDRSDSAAKDSGVIVGTDYSAYRGDLLVSELNKLSNVTIGNGYYILTSNTVGTVTKYYYLQRRSESLNDIQEKSVGTWSPTNLLWEDVGDETLRIYVTPTNYVIFTRVTGMTVTETVNALKEFNQLIPIPFTLTGIDYSKLDVLYIYNSLVDQSMSIHQSEKIRSKKTFIHLPTPVDLYDGQQFELDVSLPMIDDQDMFGFNTIGSLSGYRNFITQPRVYVLSGSQKCFGTDSKLVNDLHVQSLTRIDDIATITFTAPHGITDSEVLYLRLTGANESGYNGDFKSFVYSVNSFVFKVDPGIPLTATGSIMVTRLLFASSDNFNHSVLLDFPAVTSITRVGSVVNVNFTDELNLTIGTTFVLTVSDCDQIEYNGEFTATIYDNHNVTYTITGTPAVTATGKYSIYGYMDATQHGLGSSRLLSGESIEGLTERSNPYIFSKMPEVEFATPSNLYHQHVMGLNDLKSSDKRVLLATVYPTSVNTFNWRLDNDPQLRLMQWSVMSMHATTGSAAHMGYMANKSAYDKISPMLGTASMSLYDSSLSYSNSRYTGTDGSFESFITSRLRVLMPDTISGILTSDEVVTSGSLVFQAKKAYLESIDTFLSTRVGVVNFSTGLEPNYLNSRLAYNDNGTHANDTVLATGFNDGLLTFNNVVSPNANTSNPERWLSKGIYTSEQIVNAEGNVSIVSDDVYSGVSTVFKTYLSSNFNGDETMVNAGDRYIPSALNSDSDKRYNFGRGINNSIYTFLTKNNLGISVLNDFETQLNDWYSPIPNIGDYADGREINSRFYINENGVTKSAMSNFYQCAWMPFAKIFSTDNVSPSESQLSDMTNYTSIIGNGNLKSTLMGSIASNPLLKRYVESGYSEMFSSLNSRDDSYDTQEYIRNFLTGYSNKMPIRFYNSFRVGIYGDSSSIANTNERISRIFNQSMRDYITEYGDTLPSSLYSKYIDDNYYLHSVPGLHNVMAYDLNDSHVYFNGKGVSAKGKIEIIDPTELLDGGFASFTINGFTFTATTSMTPSNNEFTVGIGNIETATNLVKQINKSTANVLADNYAGYSHLIRLKVKTPGVLGNSYVLTYTQSSVGNIGAIVTPFTGGSAVVESKIGTLVTVSGQQFIASRDFYVNKMRFNYIRVKMRFIFSKQCGRWLTIDYRQTPTTYLTPAIGNVAFNYAEKSIVKNGRDGKSPSDYLPVIASGVNAFTNKNKLWKYDNCVDYNESYRDLWCKSYPDQSAMEMNRFCLPFLTKTFPYDDNGKLVSELNANSDSIASENYRFTGLENPVESIKFITPNNVHGGKVVKINGLEDTVNVADVNLNVFQPQLWNFYWHKRPVTSAMDGCDIPSPTDRTGGVMADPTLHNMFNFPLRENNSDTPCYLIPWHEDMTVDWLMNGIPSVDSKIMDYPDRQDTMSFDAIMNNYDWSTNSVVDSTKPIDVTRADYLEIESDRITN